MIGQGIKARTDAGESGAIAWSGSPWAFEPIVPCAPLPCDVSRGQLIERVDRLKSDVLRAAQRAEIVFGSERAAVLLANYAPTVERLLGGEA